MKKIKSEGVRRLSIIIGAITSLIWFIGLGNWQPNSLNEFLVLALGGCLLFYFIGWGFVRVIYWIYDGFRMDKNK